jgi:hypothetical protein
MNVANGQIIDKQDEKFIREKFKNKKLLLEENEDDDANEIN